MTTLQLSLRQQITKSYQQQTVTFTHFSDFAEDYKRQLEQGEILTERKVKYSEETIRQYKAAIDHFKDFEALMESRFRVNEITGDILRVYERYLTSKALSMNSVSLYISKLKAICNVLLDKGISYNQVRVLTPKDKPTKVSLSLSELKKMREAELTDSEVKVLDVFLLLCFTGLRYSTLQKFLKAPTSYIHEYEAYSYISIYADKTNDEAVIPLSQEVVNILNKYQSKVPIYSEQYLNKTIKVIGRKARLDNGIPVRITKGGVNTETIVPKFSLISSHSGRRSMVTNAKRWISDKSALMAVLNHKSEAMLANYDKSAVLEKVIPIFGNEFFNQTI